MHYYEVAPNQIVRPGSDVFTYSSTEVLRPGQIVAVEVGKRQMTGVIMRATSKPSYATKEISSVIENTPLPKPLVELASWLSGYYLTPLALVLQSLLPRGIQKTR